MSRRRVFGWSLCLPMTLFVLGGFDALRVSAQDLPIFDAHIHYSQPDWGVYSPEMILGILERAGVRRALVSSTPDDGTLRLYEKDPKRIAPMLRPYRSSGDMGSWHTDRSVLAYVEERLKKGIYKGLGEFHLSAGEANAPVVKRFVELSAQRGLFLQAHVDDVAVEELLRLDPKVKILWAHAGMSASAETVGKLLDRYHNLWVELALRTDVAPGGTLDTGWKAVFLRHPERFMVGTDTWVTSRWQDLPAAVAAVRVWLRQLPPDVARKIAHENGERLFGGP